jgi:hypothetical protein
VPRRLVVNNLMTQTRDLKERGWIYAFVAPPIGFVLGAIMAAKGEPKDGVKIMAAALSVAPIIWTLVIWLGIGAVRRFEDVVSRASAPPTASETEFNEFVTELSVPDKLAQYHAIYANCQDATCQFALCDAALSVGLFTEPSQCRQP